VARSVEAQTLSRAAYREVCEMIFISDEMDGTGVFFETLVNTTVWRSHE
jgi:hypothetical protein